MSAFRKARIAVAAVSFVLPMAGYLLTLAPSIYPGDSPEFTVAAHVLGIPHPPGYAHYVLLGKAATLFPAGNIAFRLNLFSAVGSALACSLLALLVHLWTENRLSAAAAALLLAFSRDFWAQSGSAEVYTIQVFFSLALLLLCDRTVPSVPDATAPPDDSRNRALLLATAFLFGYSLGIHYTLLFWLPGPVYLLLRRMGWRPVLRSLPAATAVALAGWALFLLMPLRAAARPPISWGETYDPVNFLTHIFWSQYSGRPVSSFSWGRLAVRTVNLVRLFREQWPWPVLLLVPPGIYRLWRRDGGGIFGAVALSLAVQGGATLFLLNDPSPEIFFGIDSNKFLAVYALIALLAALGVSQAQEWGSGGVRGSRETVRRTLSSAVATIAVLGLIVATFLGNFRSADRSRSLQLHAYALDLLDPLPAGSGVVTEYDVPSFPLLYLQDVEGYRPDVAIYGRFGVLFHDDYNAAYRETTPLGQEILRRRIDNEIIARHGGNAFFSNQNSYFAPGGVSSGHPYGLLYKGGTHSSGADLPDLLGKGFIRSPFLVDASTLDHRSRELVSDMFRMASERGIALGDRKAAAELLDRAVRVAPGAYWTHYFAGISRYRGLGDPPGAEALLRRALKIIPSEDPLLHLGVIRFESGDVPGAIRYFEEALALNPAHAPTLLNLAQCNVKLGDLARAEALLSRAVAADPTDGNAWIRLGEVQGGQNRFEEADRSLSEAIARLPSSGEAYLLRGIARLAEGKRAEGLADVRKAREIAPEENPSPRR